MIKIAIHQIPKANTSGKWSNPNIFNEYFINVAQDQKEPDNVNNMSADEVIDHYKHHPSIKLINDQVNNNKQFNVTPVNNTTTKKKLKSLQTNKASWFETFLLSF